jgi:hypothetical protein
MGEGEVESHKVIIDDQGGGMGWQKGFLVILEIKSTKSLKTNLSVQLTRWG